MADSDSDSADCQTPKKTKLELTVKEKEERYMAAAKISPQYDTMVRLFFLQEIRRGKGSGNASACGGGKRASPPSTSTCMCVCVWNMAIGFVPGTANSCLWPGASLTGVTGKNNPHAQPLLTYLNFETDLLIFEHKPNIFLGYLEIH